MPVSPVEFQSNPPHQYIASSGRGDDRGVHHRLPDGTAVTSANSVTIGPGVSIEAGANNMSLVHIKPLTLSGSDVVSLDGNGGAYAINLTLTITDADGDTSTATVDLAADQGEGAYAFNFGDDGPDKIGPFGGLALGVCGLRFDIQFVAVFHFQPYAY